MDNLYIYNVVRTVPENAKKPIKGGRLNGKTDINPMWRIRTLTEQFGPCGIGWYYKVTRQWTETYGDEVAAFVNIELYIRIEGEWSQPIFGTGGNKFAEKERSGIHVSDECFKMATTDAISVACKQLGIGADVYWEEDGSKYRKPQEETQDKRLIPVFEELSRIGYSEEFVCDYYKLKSIADISNLQIKDFMKKAKETPSKETA